MPTAVCVFLNYSFFFFLNKGKREFHPNDLANSKSLEASGRIYVYRKDLADTLVRTLILHLKHTDTDVRLKAYLRLFYNECQKNTLNCFLF